MVLQNAAVFPVAMLVGLGIITLEVGQLLWFGVFLAILFYIGFIARIALAVSLGYSRRPGRARCAAERVDRRSRRRTVLSRRRSGLKAAQ